MKKLLFLSLLMTLVAVSPALAKDNDSSFWAAASRLVQEVFQPEEMPVNFEEGQDEEMMDEEFVDPKEVQQALREIKDQKRELTRLAKQAKKLAGGEGILGEISALLEQAAGFENSINEGINLRDSIQEFRDAQIWEELNKIRAKVEIPRELAQWNKEIKKLSTMLKQKKYQNMGFDLTMAGSKVEETKATLSAVQEFYNNGDFESAMEEFDGLRQDFHPGEIMSVVQRMQELTNRLKAVKNAEVKERVKEAFSEVISNFNEGEYRIARELMDESWNDIMQMINQALSVGKKKGTSKQNFFQVTDKLQNQMKNKAEEKREQFQPQPQIQPQSMPAETVRPVESVRPIEPAPALVPSIEIQPAPEPIR
ncbi:MAG: hypothetical protein Q7R84_01560 [bacterium]|nr:hypothetical protein [bacterium]